MFRCENATSPLSEVLRNVCPITAPWILTPKPLPTHRPPLGSHSSFYTRLYTKFSRSRSKALKVKIKRGGASLVAQWLRICLPMQGTRVRALVWEDPTCRGAAGPVSHNY